MRTICILHKNGCGIKPGTVQISDVVDYSFRLVQQRRGKLTLCHKKNVLVHAGELWQTTVDEYSAKYRRRGRLRPCRCHVSAHAHEPREFDVIVTDNLFGDICPGDWTVNGAGRVKLAGTAQRIIAGAWLFGIEQVVSDPDPVLAILTDINTALELEFDPSTAASLTDLAPTISIEQVRAAVLAEVGPVHKLPVDPDVLEVAANLRNTSVP